MKNKFYIVAGFIAVILSVAVFSYTYTPSVDSEYDTALTCDDFVISHDTVYVDSIRHMQLHYDSIADTYIISTADVCMDSLKGPCFGCYYQH